MKKIKSVFFKLFCFIICISVIISVPIVAMKSTKNVDAADDLLVLNVWQIDNFEGGKGSRAGYLKNIAAEFSEKNNCFFNVIGLNEKTAILNLEAGTIPDVISYGAGICGIESCVNGYTNWCRGGYCILTLDENADFSDISAQNTIINSGTGNYVKIAAVLNELSLASYDKPTGAYVKLIEGKYKYLLGTQRDIFRLKTREVNFAVMPVTNFNDLYQNISIVTTDKIKAAAADKFIEFLISKNGQLNKLGLMNNDQKLYDDEMNIMEGINFEYKITTAISKVTKSVLDDAITNCDENKLKNLLK